MATDRMNSFYVKYNFCLLYVRFINSHNRKHLSFQVAVNHLADRSPEELAVLRGRTHTKEYNGGLPFRPDLSTLDIPDTLDWQLYGNNILYFYYYDTLEMVVFFFLLGGGTS